jgi:hypothetical protein
MAARGHFRRFDTLATRAECPLRSESDRSAALPRNGRVPHLTISSVGTRSRPKARQVAGTSKDPFQFHVDWDDRQHIAGIGDFEVRGVCFTRIAWMSRAIAR